MNQAVAEKVARKVAKRYPHITSRVVPDPQNPRSHAVMVHGGLLVAGPEFIRTGRRGEIDAKARRFTPVESSKE